MPKSPYMRRVWIEMLESYRHLYLKSASPYMRRVWIEIPEFNLNLAIDTSPYMRRVWIEIISISPE